MKPSLAFFALLGLLLFAETIAARLVPEEGSNVEMKETTMPVADKSFLKDFDPNRPQYNYLSQEATKKGFLKDFDPNRPQYIYLSREATKKGFLKDFDPNRPQYSYLSQEAMNSLEKDDQSLDIKNKDDKPEETKTSFVMDLAKTVL